MSETAESTPEGKPPLYRIGQVTLSHANRARLDSILGETVREKDSSGTLPERIGRRLARLARWWRYRVKQLEDDGWALTADNPGRYRSLMRCRPGLGSHTVKQASGACGQDWICPFCWGRDTGRVWAQVEAGRRSAPLAGREDVLQSLPRGRPRRRPGSRGRALRVGLGRSRRVAPMAVAEVCRGPGRVMNATRATIPRREPGRRELASRQRTRLAGVGSTRVARTPSTTVDRVGARRGSSGIRSRARPLRSPPGPVR